YAMCESPVDRLEIGPDDTILDYRHFSWSSPQILSIGPALLTGATLVLARKFSQARFFDWLRDYRVTVAVGIPTVINMLLARPTARVGLLAGAGHARADPPGRLQERRPRPARRGGLRLHHRSQEGHHHQGRREHRLARDHELPARARRRRRRRHARGEGRDLR